MATDKQPRRTDEITCGGAVLAEWWWVEPISRAGQLIPECRAWLILVCFLTTCGRAAEVQGTTVSAQPRYEYRQIHDPDGIGKYYLGREIAAVMGHQGADWLERSEREAEEAPDQLVRQLKVRPGDVVADIGAGTGYISRRLARQVGPGGRVLAVDIQPEMLELLTNRMAALGIANVVPVLGTPTNPHLSANSVDLVLMVDVYHEFDFPFEMMSRLCRALKPDGRIVFVEYRGEDPAVPIKPLHKMTETQVRKEMRVQPLRWIETVEVLPRQHIIVFAKRASNAEQKTSN